MPLTVRPPLDWNYVFTLHSYARFPWPAAVVVVELHGGGDSARLTAFQLADMLFGIEAPDRTAQLFFTCRIDLFFRLIRETAKALRMDYLVLRIARCDYRPMALRVVFENLVRYQLPIGETLVR